MATKKTESKTSIETKEKKVVKKRMDYDEKKTEKSPFDNSYSKYFYDFELEFDKDKPEKERYNRILNELIERCEEFIKFCNTELEKINEIEETTKLECFDNVKRGYRKIKKVLEENKEEFCKMKTDIVKHNKKYIIKPEELKLFYLRRMRNRPNDKLHYPLFYKFNLYKIVYGDDYKDNPYGDFTPFFVQSRDEEFKPSLKYDVEFNVGGFFGGELDEDDEERLYKEWGWIESDKEDEDKDV
jgi:hypothetical protein